LDLYHALKRFKDANNPLGGLAQRLLDGYLQLFQRNGAALDDEKRKHYENLNKKISDLCIKFLQNVNEDTSHCCFTKEELDGRSHHWTP
jgi:Zn-dependent oligopeptidase